MLTSWECSSNGGALALHARGTGFDTPHLHNFFLCMFFFQFRIHSLLAPFYLTSKFALSQIQILKHSPGRSLTDSET